MSICGNMNVNHQLFNIMEIITQNHDGHNSQSCPSRRKVASCPSRLKVADKGNDVLSIGNGGGC